MNNKIYCSTHPSLILSCLSLITKWSLITENRFGLYWSLTGSDSAEESRSYFKGDRSRMTTSWNSDLSASKMSSPGPSSSSETASVVWLPTKPGSAVSWLMYHLEYIFSTIFFSGRIIFFSPQTRGGLRDRRETRGCDRVSDRVGGCHTCDAGTLLRQI